MHRTQYALVLGTLTLGIFGTVACSTAGGQPPQPHAAPTAVATSTQATAVKDDIAVVADEMLNALNRDDYRAFSARWDRALKDGIDEGAFHAFRNQTVQERGGYQAITHITSAPSTKTPGSTNYFVQARFERATMTLRVNMRDGAKEISGVELTPEQPS